MPKRLSPVGLAKLKELEGYRAQPYDDGAGYLTVGYGHKLHDGDNVPATLSLAQAHAVLLADLVPHEAAVNSFVTVPLTQPEFDALVLFAFNVGDGAFEESTLLRVLNDGHYTAVPEELMRWHFAHGVSMPGLMKRRLAECVLWNS